MKQGVGTVMTFNIIIIFLLLMFGAISATVSYYKAYKLSSRVTLIIEKYEGYNQYAQNEISDMFKTMGYSHSRVKACVKDGKGLGTLEVASQSSAYDYCVYKSEIKQDRKKYLYYDAITYMTIDFPLINKFSIPIKVRTEKIYEFGSLGS